MTISPNPTPTPTGCQDSAAHVRRPRLPIEYAPAKVRQFGYSDAHTRPLVSRGKIAGKPYKSWRVSPDIAWKMPVIELNPANAWSVLVLDLDGMGAAARLNGLVWSGKLPLPSWTVKRESSGGTHAVWCLRDRVHRGPDARAKPLKLFAAVSEYYSMLTAADRGYRHVLTHNPVWKLRAANRGLWTTWGRQSPYGLRDLAAYIPEHWRMPRQPSELDTDAGRNCYLFDSGIRFARHHLDGDGPGDILDYLALLNETLRPFPLTQNEIAGIARSVDRYRKQWIIGGRLSPAYRARKAAMGRKGGRNGSRQDKRKAGSAGGRQSVAVRRAAAAGRWTAPVNAARAGRPLRSVAAEYGVSLSGLRRRLRQN